MAARSDDGHHFLYNKDVAAGRLVWLPDRRMLEEDRAKTIAERLAGIWNMALRGNFEETEGVQLSDDAASGR